MYNKITHRPSTINFNEALEGETIEAKMRRVVNNKEPINDGAPIIYQERKEGVNPAYDIRTDRWELATDLMDMKQKQEAAKRADRHKTEAQKEKEKLDADYKKAQEKIKTQNILDTIKQAGQDNP